jgi:hypothetical protein
MTLSCPEEKDALIDHALAYAARGWSIIPTTGKRAAGVWTPFQTRAPDEKTLRRLFTKKNVTGLGVITGKVSGGLAVRDFDKEASYRAWATDHPGKATTLPTVRTARGYHVYGDLDHEMFANLGDGELRADSGHYVLLPPSAHPDGITYTWIVPLPNGPLPALPDSLTQTGQIQHTQADPAPPSKPSKHIAWFSSAIATTLPAGPGQRNQCIFQLARRLKAIMPDATPTDLRVILQEWHRQALPNIRTKDFGESWADFCVACERVKRPAGQSFTRAAANAQRIVPRIADERGYDGHLRRLTALCWQLQRQWGERPFPLGCKIAGDFLGLSTVHAWRLLNALAFDGILERVTKGTKRSGKASEWRFVGGGN